MNFNWVEPPPTTNIYAKEGDRVRFLNRNGHDYEPEEALKCGLIEGGVYTVEMTNVAGWHTDVYLKEFPGNTFNSVMFEDYTDES